MAHFMTNVTNKILTAQDKYALSAKKPFKIPKVELITHNMNTRKASVREKSANIVETVMEQTTVMSTKKNKASVLDGDAKDVILDTRIIIIFIIGFSSVLAKSALGALLQKET